MSAKSAEADTVLGPELGEPRHIETASEQGVRTVRKVDDALLADSAAVLSDVMAFRDIMPSDEVPPEEWVRQMGPEEAQKRLNLARAAWMNAKEAPAGIRVAVQLYSGILKARASELKPEVTINVGAIQFGPPAEKKKLPTKVIDADGD